MRPQHLNRRSPRSAKIGGSSSIAHYNRSLRLLGSQDAPAFEENRKAADEGMHDAVLAMGWFYLNGVGVDADEEEAVRWYSRSARQGEPRAMFSLGWIAYERRDFSEALTWFARATDKGHHRSRYWIGKMYWRGQGVTRDRKRARELFSQAASQKVAEAQRALRFLNYLSNIA
jgi:TPR repeat protein